MHVKCEVGGNVCELAANRLLWKEGQISGTIAGHTTDDEGFGADIISTALLQTDREIERQRWPVCIK